MRLLAIVFLLLAVGCKGQKSVFGTVASRLSLDMTDGTNTTLDAEANDYLSWYNSVAKKPLYDTTSEFKMPAFSDLRYVIIYNRSKEHSARVEYDNGRFITMLPWNRMWIEEVTYNRKGEIIGGMRPIQVISPVKDGLIVQYERCVGCVFNPKDKGEL